jgi:hypothetical protein
MNAITRVLTRDNCECHTNVYSRARTALKACSIHVPSPRPKIPDQHPAKICYFQGGNSYLRTWSK